MKEEIKDIWVAALRSGKHRQAKGTLHVYRGGYCCLGELCELAVQAGVIDVPIPVQNRWEFDHHTGNLPPSVMRWSGIRDRCGAIRKNLCLSVLNDNGKTFAEIADIIDEHWEAL